MPLDAITINALKCELCPAVAGARTRVAQRPLAVSVPSGATAMIGDKTIVFVATGGGYAIRDVKIGGSVGGQTVLLSGVRPGEQVVVSGTSALKALALSR